jgi:hypothetical protein
MIRFQLFRLRLFKNPTLFNYNVDRIELLKEVIYSRPSAEIRKGYWWHIGNVNNLDNDGAYFALGRTTKSIVEMYDLETRNFVVDEHSESPYTHTYIDFPYQILAIAYKPRIAPYTKTIAKQLEKLLNTRENLKREVIIEVAQACAAAGNDASARMKDTKQSRFRTRRLKGRAVTLDYDENDHDEFQSSFMKAIRETYKAITEKFE